MEQVKAHAYFEGLDWVALEAKQLPPPHATRRENQVQAQLPQHHAAGTADVYTGSQVTKTQSVPPPYVGERRGVSNTALP